MKQVDEKATAPRDATTTLSKVCYCSFLSWSVVCYSSVPLSARSALFTHTIEGVELCGSMGDGIRGMGRAQELKTYQR